MPKESLSMEYFGGLRDHTTTLRSRHQLAYSGVIRELP